MTCNIFPMQQVNVYTHTCHPHTPKKSYICIEIVEIRNGEDVK